VWSVRALSAKNLQRSASVGISENKSFSLAEARSSHRLHGVEYPFEEFLEHVQVASQFPRPDEPSLEYTVIRLSEYMRSQYSDADEAIYKTSRCALILDTSRSTWKTSTSVTTRYKDRLPSERWLESMSFEPCISS